MTERELPLDCLRRLHQTEEVLLHKLLWNRLTPSERQLGDAAGVVAVQGATLDVDYLHHWAAELKVDEVLRRLLQGEIRPKST